MSYDLVPMWSYHLTCYGAICTSMICDAKKNIDAIKKEICKLIFRILKGGADTGFRHVKPEEYTPRLFHFCGTRKHVEVREVCMSSHFIYIDVRRYDMIANETTLHPSHNL